MVFTYVDVMVFSKNTAWHHTIGMPNIRLIVVSEWKSPEEKQLLPNNNTVKVFSPLLLSPFKRLFTRFFS